MQKYRWINSGEWNMRIWQPESVESFRPGAQEGLNCGSCSVCHKSLRNFDSLIVNLIRVLKMKRLNLSI